MKSKSLQKLKDLFEVNEVMEEEFDSVSLKELQALWDHESVSPIVTNMHELVLVEEIEEYSAKEIGIKGIRAFVYECKKCGKKVVVPASENDISEFSTLTCDETVVDEVMDE
jgi:hypothetical protein